MLARAAIRLCKAARLLPAALAVDLPDARALARDAGLTRLDAAEVLRLTDAASPLNDIVAARLPMSVSEAGRLHIFRPEDGGEEHYAVEIGDPDRAQPVLTRLHSACFTGDLLGSLKCDCGPQLRGALAQMGAAGSGVLLYLNQEGRGIGLANKLRAYQLQESGVDTLDANLQLGLPADARDYRAAAEILADLGLRSIRLLTNNPDKVAQLEASGVTISERVPLYVGLTEQNAGYLAAKRDRMGHMIPTDSNE